MIFIIFLFLFSINKFNNVYNEKKNTFNNGNDYYLLFLLLFIVSLFKN